jgi:hypothetical protein
VAQWMRLPPELASHYRELGATPAEADLWRSYEHEADEFEELLRCGLAPSMIIEWAPLDSPTDWHQQGVELHDALHWERRGFTVESSESWRQHSFSPKASYYWREIELSASEVKTWRGAGFSYTKIKAARLGGFTLEDLQGLGGRSVPVTPVEDWDTTPIGERPIWRAAGVTPHTASRWAELIERETPLQPPGPEDDILWLRRPAVIAGFTMSEALRWHRAGFSPHADDLEYFENWRDAGFTPEDAQPLLEATIVEELFWGPEEALRAGIDYRNAGIPLTAANLTNWGGLAASRVLDAVDRGFQNAKEYAPFASSDLHAPDAQRLMEILRDPKLVRQVWEARTTGLGEEDLIKWVSAGFTAESIAMWHASGLDPSAATDWQRTDFTPTEASSWLAAGFHVANDALTWKAAGFDPLIAAPWHLAGVSPEDAAAWQRAAITIDAAQRRISAGLRPPQV